MRDIVSVEGLREGNDGNKGDNGDRGLTDKRQLKGKVG